MKLLERIKSLGIEKMLAYAALVFIIVLAIYLRSYHIDYPTIGYHNMKEDEFLSFAVNMWDSKDFFRTTWFDCSVSGNDYYTDPYKACNFNEGESPLSIWALMIFLVISGWKIWAARLFIILFAAATVVILYVLVKKLSDKEYLAVLSAFFYAIIPLSVFFGRNIQMDSPSLFFVLCALYYYLKWIENREMKTFITASIFFVLTAWFKITSLFVLAPIIMFLPYKEFILHYKKYYKEAAIMAGVLLLSISWIVFLAPALMPDANVNSISEGNFVGKNNWVDLSFSIFGQKYWTDYKMILKSYLADNYSMLGVWMILLGFALFLLKYKSKMSRFMIGYAIGILIYIILFAYKWNAHNYYQFPFLAFAAICMANVIYQAGMLIKALSGPKYGKYAQFAAILLIFVTIPTIGSLHQNFKASTYQQFNTQFFGQDIAGTYINEHTREGEIFLLERGIQHQVSWTARRFYYGIPDNETILKDLEEKKGLRYIVLTNYGIGVAQQRPSWNYIQNNYHIAQIGFIQTGQGPQAYHIVLEKGGKFDYNSLSTMPARQISEYELSYVKVPYYVIEVN